VNKIGRLTRVAKDEGFPELYHFDIFSYVDIEIAYLTTIIQEMKVLAPLRPFFPLFALAVAAACTSPPVAAAVLLIPRSSSTAKTPCCTSLVASALALTAAGRSIWFCATWSRIPESLRRGNCFWRICVWRNVCLLHGKAAAKGAGCSVVETTNDAYISG